LYSAQWLRFDQFAYQVVTDDEWHALNQLVAHSPRQFLLSFGFPTTAFH
jgi:hypothetical protein